MSKTGQKTGRPRNKIWEEFDVDAELAKKRYCRCKWCKMEVKADTARMYYHITDRCNRVESEIRQKYHVRDDMAEASGGQSKETLQDIHKDLPHLLKAKGGRPKDPIWQEFQTNEDLRKRRYCLCVWCEKEVKGDTSRMLGHILERCNRVDANTKAKYVKRKSDARDDISDIETTVPNVPAVKRPKVAAPAPQESFTTPQYGFLKDLSLDEDNLGVFCGEWFGNGAIITVINPATNETIATVRSGTRDDYMHVVYGMDQAKVEWERVPVLQRAHLVNQISYAFRAKQTSLSQLMALEMGVVLNEAAYLVNKMIESCDVAAAKAHTIQDAMLSSHQANQVRMERHTPLRGHVGVLTPFHAPCWRGAMALVCGNAVLWKPSLSLTAIAITKIISNVFIRHGYNPACSSLISGSGADIGEMLTQDKHIDVVSFTGSVEIGHRVGLAVADRLGRSIMHLDTQPAVVIDMDANLDHAVHAIIVAISRRKLRQIYVHMDVCDLFLNKISLSYNEIVVGNPFNSSTTCGPLRNHNAVQKFSNTINTIQMTCGHLVEGGNMLDCAGNFVSPALIMVGEISGIHVDMLSPITFVSKFHSLERVMEERPLERIVLFTGSTMAAFKWSGYNVVGINCDVPRDDHGATTDDWKQYMRRSICTVNIYSSGPIDQQQQPSLDTSQMTTLHVL
ncbi:unnamed protein product [Aphanomyces euteiches]